MIAGVRYDGSGKWLSGGLTAGSVWSLVAGLIDAEPKMDVLRIDELPSLQHPAFVLAFGGWNDAAEAATSAVHYLRRTFSARRFASIDAEDFFDFTSLRPMIRVVEGQYRKITWPDMEFLHCRPPGLQRDLMLGVGAEPHLRWRTFVGAIVSLARQCDVAQVITLGALVADVAHSRPVPVTGSSTDRELAERLNLTPTRYEGPTGIVGVLHDACRREGLPSVSLWASTPHYVGGIANAKATLALLTRLGSLLAVRLDLRELNAARRRFDAQVSEALAGNRELSEYVRQLEERQDAADEAEGGAGPGELPSGERLVEELERFLRQQRKEKGQD